MFRGTGVIITDDGRCYPGSALGTDEFLISYVQDKVTSWMGEIEKLSDIAVTQPQAAYAAFTHVFCLVQCQCLMTSTILLMKS